MRSEVAGNRIRTWHLMPTDRMDPPPGASPLMRMTASWSGSNDPTEYKSAVRNIRPMASSPRIPQQTDKTSTDQTRTMQKAHIAVHRRSACSGLKALRNTSIAKAAKPPSRQAALAFRSLDPFRALREPDRRRRDGERLSDSEQRTGNKEPAKTKKHDLTGKAPYRCESRSLQRRVGGELRSELGSMPSLKR
jgi:hypothetical protein